MTIRADRRKDGPDNVAAVLATLTKWPLDWSLLDALGVPVLA
jgi:hypothetical protein